MTTTANEGHVVGGRYRLQRVLGRGGMGTVWQAHDELLDRDVAIKEILLPLELTGDERQVLYQRTLREARSAARISHRNVVTVFDVVEEDSRPWIVMEVVASRSLAEIIREDGPLGPRQTARLGLELLSALRVAHRVGVLHRDVKPSNVLIGRDDRVVLTDFGIATVEGDPSITKSGILVGAPAYMAPERARGQKAEPKSDLWSLGATLYTAVEGRAPHDRVGAMATLMAVLDEEPDPPRRAGPLWPVLQGLLRRDPEERLDAAGAELMLRRVEAAAQARRAPLVKPKPAIAAPAPTPTPEPDGRAEPGGAAVPAGTTSDGAGTDAPPARRAEGPATAAAEQPTMAARADDTGPTAGAMAGPTAGATGGGTDPSRAVPATAPEASPKPTPPAEPTATRTAQSAPRTGPPSWWRRMPAAALLPLLLIGGAVLAWALWPDGDPDRGARPGGQSAGGQPASGQPSGAARTPSTSPPTGSSPGQSGGPANPAGTMPAPTGSTAGAAPPAAPPTAVPAGFRRYRDPTGFSLAVPNGWRKEVRDGVVYFREPNSRRFLLIDQEENPPQDMLADSRQQERNRRSGYDDYRRVRLERVAYRWQNTADWEFTYSGQQERLHVLIRSVLPTPARSYGIYWSTPDAQWAQSTRYFQVFSDTFLPAPD